MILELKNKECHKKWIYVKPRREPELDSTVWQTFVIATGASRDRRSVFNRDACNPVCSLRSGPTMAIRPEFQEIASFTSQPVAIKWRPDGALD